MHTYTHTGVRTSDSYGWRTSLKVAHTQAGHDRAGRPASPPQVRRFDSCNGYCTPPGIWHHHEHYARLAQSFLRRPLATNSRAKKPRITTPLHHSTLISEQVTFVPKSPTSSQYLWDLMYSALCTDAFLNSMSMEAGETFIPANKHRHHSFRSLLYLSIKLSHWPTKIMHSLKRLWHNSQDKLTMNRRCFVFVLHLMSDAHICATTSFFSFSTAKSICSVFIFLDG